jgi:predicted dehydrogenase
MTRNRLGVGFIGSGFNARFHIRSWIGVRDADVRGVWSPNPERAEEAAALARSLRVGEARAYASIEEMVAAPEIDCVWICGPNHARIDNMERIVAARGRGAELVGIACEKPLARNVGEARRVLELVENAGVLHGYLENQLFAPTLARAREIAWARGAALSGRPYLARAAEEHSGPHMPWFWRGDLQGGGVLNDMMCHSLEVGRHLLTKPGAPRSSIRPTKVQAQIASLKWSRPADAAALRASMGAEVDYAKRPSEDFARATVGYVDEAGHSLIVEATTSWSFVGAGLRLSMELLGPEYSVSVNTLDAGAKVFFSRRVQGAGGRGPGGEAERGAGPDARGRRRAGRVRLRGENRHFVRCFLDGVQPEEDFRAGLEVTELLMTAYMSAEQEKTLGWKPEGLERYVPPVARGDWKP